MSRKEDQRQFYRLYADVARAYLKSKKVLRYHLKKVSDMDDKQVIQACHFWYEHNGQAEDYQAFQALYFSQHQEEYLTVHPVNRKDDSNE